MAWTYMTGEYQFYKKIMEFGYTQTCTNSSLPLRELTRQRASPCDTSGGQEKVKRKFLLIL